MCSYATPTSSVRCSSKKMYKKTRHVLNPRIKWWKLKGDGQTPFVSRLIKEANQEDEVDSNVMWNKMVDCIRHVAKEELGESKGMMRRVRTLHGGMRK